MEPTSWALYALVTVGLFAAALLHYRRHEPAGRGRYVLAGLRGAALALVVLLLFDPALPARGAAGRAPTVALVDASLSMRLASPDGTTRWEEAVRAVRMLGPDRIVVFGSGPARSVPSLDGLAPGETETRLGPALRSTLEGGAGRIVVVTDGGLEDADDVERLAADAAVPLAVRVVGQRTAWNAGLVEVEGPGWTRAEEEVDVRLGVARTGEGAPDSLMVRLLWGARELARAAVPTPPEGRVSTASLRFTPPDGMAGAVRLDAELMDGGAETADDRRTLYIRVEDQPAGVVLVSFRPDQEPRFLLPVLERALGVPVRGWLRIAPGRFIRLGVGREAGLAEPETDVRRALAGADLVVLHGVDGSEPPWAREAARRKPALLFPRAPMDGVPVRPGPAVPGDWYAAGEVPGSPVAPFLAGVPVQRAPPLTAIHPAEAPGGWWVPLEARQDRRGEARPVLMAGQVDGRRVAVALAQGYWRWAFSDEGGRSLYEALWAGVAGWLAEQGPGRAPEGVRAHEPVVPRGEPLRWIVPPAADSVRITLHPLDATETVDADLSPGRAPGAGETPGVGAESPVDTVVAAAGGVAVRAAPRPGHYRYEVAAFVAAVEGGSVAGSGELTVERYSREFTRPARALAWADAPDGIVGARRSGFVSVSRPLRSMVWPWLAIVGLLCAEWVLRRRWGLR